VQVIEFTRPERHDDADLIITLGDAVINLEQGNEVIITNDMNQSPLRLSIALRKPNSAVELSNTIKLGVRDTTFGSIGDATVPPQPPSPAVFIKSGDGTVTNLRFQDGAFYGFVSDNDGDRWELFGAGGGENNGGGNGGYIGDIDWDNIANKPNTFTPAEHTHDVTEITNSIRTINGESPDAYGNIVVSGSGVVTDNAEHGNYNPISSHGVFNILGKINILLEAI